MAQILGYEGHYHITRGKRTRVRGQQRFTNRQTHRQCKPACGGCGTFTTVSRPRFLKQMCLEMWKLKWTAVTLQSEMFLNFPGTVFFSFSSCLDVTVISWPQDLCLLPTFVPSLSECLCPPVYAVVIAFMSQCLPCCGYSLSVAGHSPQCRCREMDAPRRQKRLCYLSEWCCCCGVCVSCELWSCSRVCEQQPEEKKVWNAQKHESVVIGSVVVLLHCHS